MRAVALLLVLTSSFGTAVAVAQPEPAPEPQPTSDLPTLESGFTPDPIRVTGRTRSLVSLHTRAPSCQGFAGYRPDHRMRLGSAFGFLRLFLVAGGDLTLAIRRPDGTWQCATASPEQAALIEGRFGAGEYELFVGSPQHSARVSYELQVTEFRSVSPGEDRADASSSIDVGLETEAEEGRFRGRRIRRGFIPDPIEDQATADGAVDVRLLGADCRGFVAAAPSHVMTLRTEFDYLRVQLGGVRGRAAMVLRTPGGRYLCSAPDDTNAFVDQDAWPEGVYRIWVGTLEPEASLDYRICYTEARLAEASATCGTSDEPPPPVRAEVADTEAAGAEAADADESEDGSDEAESDEEESDEEESDEEEPDAAESDTGESDEPESDDGESGDGESGDGESGDGESDN